MKITDSDKRRINRITTLIFLITAFAFIACFIYFFFQKANYNTGSNDPENTGTVSENADPGNGQNTGVAINIGDTPITDYTINYDMLSQEAAKCLKEYIDGITDGDIKISKREKEDKYISVTVKKDKNGIEIRDGNISIYGSTPENCTHQVNVFANAYLGYAFAGEDRQFIIDNDGSILIPEDVYSCEEPWIEKREPIICLWKTDTARGIYKDANVSLKSELMDYSDDMLYQYVKMMKYLGFTGIQVTEMCSAWAQYGSYEYIHERLRFMADAAHSLDMDFTLWVWGAEFNGYGWNDKSVVYIDYYTPSRELPEAIETFEKYYDIYAELADCSDRVIMHFNDPGNLVSSEDIGYFAKMFREKCRAKNPDIIFGINCYTNQIDIDDLHEYLGEDVVIYTCAVKSDDSLPTYSDCNLWAKNNGMERGVWSWNLCEMEIDQLAEMNVNARIIADTYRNTRLASEGEAPVYWSEMDSYHMLNLFSLYCSGKLLQDPDLDPDVLLSEVSREVVGEEYADDLSECLSIIQDARSGNGWKEFKNDYDEYLLLSDSYPAGELLERCNEAIPKLEKIIEAKPDCSTIPLTFSASELMELMLPHLKEIKEYSEFRIALDEAKEMLNEGRDKEEIEKFIKEKYKPVHEYNTITGCWGQAEARAQYRLLDEFCESAGIETPGNKDFDEYRKNRILGEIKAKQECTDELLTFDLKHSFQLGLAYGEKETERLTLELVDEGKLVMGDDGRVYLGER